MSEDDQSIDALLETELYEFCQSSSLSEDGLREIIIERYGASKNPNITNYGFFRWACNNELVTEGILRLLHDFFPDAASACDNKGWMPLHVLCANGDLDEAVGLEILEFLLKKCPEAVKHRLSEKEKLPIHLAATRQSPEFCRQLIAVYPESEQIQDKNGLLPFHCACCSNTVATVKYLYNLYPESINVADIVGSHPIFYAVVGLKIRRNLEEGINVLHFLLELSPDELRVTGETPLHIICGTKHVTLNIVQLLTDAFPESLRRADNDGWMPLHKLCHNENLGEDVGLEIMEFLLERCPEAVKRRTNEKAKLPIHFAAARQSPEFCHRLIAAYSESEQIQDKNGLLPFHCACHSNTVATVKYLYNLYPESINVADNDGVHPIFYTVVGLKSRCNLAEGINVVQFLLHWNPDELRVTGKTPLHIICGTKHVKLNVVQLLIVAFPESLLQEDNEGWMPLHVLCGHNKNEKVPILKLLLEKLPEAVRHTTNIGSLPLHLAAKTRSPDFCRILIEAYPGSERMTVGNQGILPFHLACQYNTVATVKYFYQRYPESISMASNNGLYPIHNVIWGLTYRGGDDPEAAGVEVIQFLLDCNTDVASQKHQDKFPIYWVCRGANSENTPKLNAHLKVLQMLYDAYPEAIKEDEITFNVDSFCQEVQIFINAQLAYARQATDHSLMHSPDESGQLPLHIALRDNATLGSIKLLVKGNPSAVQTFDNSGILPLHLACQHHHSPSVVEYLVGVSSLAVKMKDLCQNTLLHFACRVANHAMIAFLLEKYDAAFVSSRNSSKQLPIDLLFESEAVSDREGIEYMESIYRLIRANPDTLMGCDIE